MLAANLRAQVSLKHMVGDEERAKKVLVGYVSAQLQSGLAAMEAALQLSDAELSYRAAQNYMTVADVSRQLYCDYEDFGSLSTEQNHSWGLLMQELQRDLNVTIQRKKRLPYVQGNARVQLELLREIRAVMPIAHCSVGFRRRGEELIVSLRGATELPSELIIAGSRHALFAAARQSSLAAIRGYILARRAHAAGVRLVVVGSAVHMHFQIFRQLKMSF